jgi:NADH-quinone oxidoreductase subunit E
MLRGADEMVAYLQRALGVRDGQTTSDGAITWHSTIECLGACGGAPMMQVDHHFEENLTEERIDTIIEGLRQPVPVGQATAVPAAEPPKRKTAAPKRVRSES